MCMCYIRLFSQKIGLLSCDWAHFALFASKHCSVYQTQSILLCVCVLYRALITTYRVFITKFKAFSAKCRPPSTRYIYIYIFLRHVLKGLYNTWVFHGLSVYICIFIAFETQTCACTNVYILAYRLIDSSLLRLLHWRHKYMRVHMYIQLRTASSTLDPLQESTDILVGGTTCAPLTHTHTMSSIDSPMCVCVCGTTCAPNNLRSQQLALPTTCDLCLDTHTHNLRSHRRGSGTANKTI